MDSLAHKTCVRCETFKPLSAFYVKQRKREKAYHFSRCKACMSEVRKQNYKESNVYYRDNREHILERLRRVAVEVKLEMIAEYGGRCACCGETQMEFLALDHIQGGGNKDREETQGRGGTPYYKMLKRQGWPKGKHQILCHNCNQAKATYGMCPHGKA